MSYAFITEVPANEEMYGKIRSLLPAESPKGLVTHVVIKREGGLRYVDVWDTQADWERFRDEHVEPAVEKVLAGYGIPHDHNQVASEDIEVIDVWLGTAPR